MTPAALEKRLRFWQRALKLDHWTIAFEVVDECSTGPEASACVFRSNDYDTADVQVRADVADKSGFELDITIVHELLHILFRDYDEAVNDILSRLHDADHPVSKARMAHENEGVIDRLARLLVSATLQA